ncbi:hypothetical protein MRB53_003082 [Persea americana]|uniref:Uncharacterized protein n=1 Tax=Persea americana TaxID=3435 RepID=A0ACC2MWF9_PERAE|nr:hypothetical protein MRB53_003082 [Persea americana]
MCHETETGMAAAKGSRPGGVVGELGLLRPFGDKMVGCQGGPLNTRFKLGLLRPNDFPFLRPFEKILDGEDLGRGGANGREEKMERI